MIFSKEKWEDEREGLDYVKASNAFSWETVKSPLRNAWNLFVVPLVGEETAETLSETYRQDQKSATDEKPIRLAQRATVLLALWYDYAELNVLMGDSGFKRQESEDTRTPYKYQEKQLRDGWKTKGFNALDDLLRFLEENIDEYPDYAQSENYTRSRNAIIQNTEQVNESYFINRSRLTYLRLKPHFKTVEETIVAPRMGDLYRQLKTGLSAETPDEKYIALRNAIRPAIVHYAVGRLLLETGDLSDKGLFFASLVFSFLHRLRWNRDGENPHPATCFSASKRRKTRLPKKSSCLPRAKCFRTTNRAAVFRRLFQLPSVRTEGICIG